MFIKAQHFENLPEIGGSIIIPQVVFAGGGDGLLFQGPKWMISSHVVNHRAINALLFYNLGLSMICSSVALVYAFDTYSDCCSAIPFCTKYSSYYRFHSTPTNGEQAQITEIA